MGELMHTEDHVQNLERGLSAGAFRRPDGRGAETDRDETSDGRDGRARTSIFNQRARELLDRAGLVIGFDTHAANAMSLNKDGISRG